MKNDDVRDDLPSIRVHAEERPGMAANNDGAQLAIGLRTPVRPVAGSHGAFWAVCVALALALLWLGWWSHQQQTSLQRQLVATQDSFARISEEASGRIQDITGKVSATESTLTEAERALEQRLQRLDASLQTLQTRMQAGEQALEQFRGGERQQAARLQTLQTELREVEAKNLELAEQMQKLQKLQREQLAVLESQQDGLAQALNGLEQQLAALQPVPQQLQAVREQLTRHQAELQRQQAAPDLAAELLILRSELDQRLASSEEALAAIDAFRLQTNRSLSAMQDQLRTLQGARQ